MKLNPFQTIFDKLVPNAEKIRGIAGLSTLEKIYLEEIEKTAIVDETIVPYFGGRVRFQSSWWPALCQQNITLFPGEIVYVVGRHNLILLVEPAFFFKESHEGLKAEPKRSFFS